jgi:hypothetical protein
LGFRGANPPKENLSVMHKKSVIRELAKWTRAKTVSLGEFELVSFQISHLGRPFAARGLNARSVWNYSMGFSWRASFAAAVSEKA